VSAFPSGVTIAFLEEVAMDVLHERCAGLDVHQETVVCCLLISEPDGRCRKEFRTFGAMTGYLEALRDWLIEHGVTHVAMESTGVFLKPVHAVLEGHVEVMVSNAQHIRNGFGRRDPKRALRSSFDPASHPGPLPLGDHAAHQNFLRKCACGEG
jgi:hypothetical protein